MNLTMRNGQRVGALIMFLLHMPPAFGKGERDSAETAEKPSFLQRAWETLQPVPYDPTDPTQLTTNLAVLIETSDIDLSLGGGRLDTGRFLLAYATDEQFALEFEGSVSRFKGPAGETVTGSGDTRVGILWIPTQIKDLEVTYNGTLLNFNVIAPTGKFEKGLGSGNWTLSPGILAALNLKYVRAFPRVYYSFGVAGHGEEGVDREQSSDEFGFDVAIAIPLSPPWYGVVTPAYVESTSPDTDRDRFSVFLSFGRLFGSRLDNAFEVYGTKDVSNKPGLQSTFGLSYTRFF